MAYNDILSTDTHGVDTQASYPYVSGLTHTAGTCSFNYSTIGSKMTSYVTSTTGDENWLMNAVANVGPISACLYVSKNFKKYKNG